MATEWLQRERADHAAKLGTVDNGSPAGGGEKGGTEEAPGDMEEDTAEGNDRRG